MPASAEENTPEDFGTSIYFRTAATLHRDYQIYLFVDSVDRENSKCTLGVMHNQKTLLEKDFVSSDYASEWASPSLVGAWLGDQFKSGSLPSGWRKV